MPSIGDYLGSVQILLVEFGKYFTVLLLAVLAFRMARGSRKLSGAGRWQGGWLAGGLGLLAAVVGFISIHNSLGKLYFHYAEAAFNAGRLEQADSLFDASGKFWGGADVTGRRGVCRLLMGDTNAGVMLLEQAATQRPGGNNGFEKYHEGLYYLMTGQEKTAIPFLSAISADPAYHWIVLKYFAALDLDAGDTGHAAEMMKPYMSATVTEGDQACIIAALKLADGKPDEAGAVLAKFSASDLTPFWRERFEKLQAQIKTNTPAQP